MKDYEDWQHPASAGGRLISGQANKILRRRPILAPLAGLLVGVLLLALAALLRRTGADSQGVVVPLLFGAGGILVLFALAGLVSALIVRIVGDRDG